MDKSGKKNVKETEALLHRLLQFYASFFPGFYLLEYTLKERIYNHIKNKLGTDWFTQKITESQHDPLFSQEKEYITRRKPAGFEVTEESLKVETGLGFWIEFFNRRLYKEVKGIPITIFKKLPKEIKRKDIYIRLERIRRLRNQLMHSRIAPVAGSYQLKHLESMLETAKQLGEILQWLGELPKKIINVKAIIKEGKEIKKLLN